MNGERPCYPSYKEIALPSTNCLKLRSRVEEEEKHKGGGYYKNDKRPGAMAHEYLPFFQYFRARNF